VVPFAEDEEISDEEDGPKMRRPFEDL
jgi:hypothetical protein